MRERQLTSFDSNTVFGALFFHANTGMIAADSNNIIQLINPFALQFLGYLKEEIEGKRLKTILPGIDTGSRKSDESVVSVKPTGNAELRTVRAIKKNGEFVPVEISVSYLQAQNEIISLLFIKDISEEQKANEKFYKLFHESPAGIILSEADSGIMLDVNEGFCKMTGYRRDELIGRSSNEMGLYRWGSEREKIRNVIREKGKLLNYELEIVTKKSDVISVLLFAETVELNNSQCFLTTVLDITEKRIAAEKLDASEENYRLIFNGMHDSFLLQEIERDENKKVIGLRIIDINPVAEKMLGKKREDVIGHMRNEFLGDLNEEMINIIDRLDGTREVVRFQQYIPMLDKWFNRTIFSPKPGQIVGIGEDITAEKQARHELQKINEALEEKVLQRTKELVMSLEREKELSEMKSRFVSTASHEFRTPLTTILTSMELIEFYQSDELVEKRNTHIARVKSSVNHLVDILNDFLSLEKAERGKVEIKKEYFNLNDFNREVVDQIKGTVKDGQTIVSAFSGPEEVLQDKRTLRHILLNLLSNAIKFSGDNKQIALQTEVNESAIHIQVKDDGIGIPKEEQAHLFSNFFRASNTANIEGTGLGLSIVKKYVELLNGNISFTSNYDEGTTFCVELPLN